MISSIQGGRLFLLKAGVVEGGRERPGCVVGDSPGLPWSLWSCWKKRWGMVEAFCARVTVMMVQRLDL